MARPSPGRLLAFAALGSLAFSAIAGAAPAWTGPVELSAANRALFPDVALNAAGDAIVVWNRQDGEVCPTAPENPACKHVVEAISRLPGSTAWQPPVALAEPGVGPGPRVAVDQAGNAVVVWSHDVGEPRYLQASYRRGRGGPWDSPIDVSDDRFREGTQQVGFDAAGNVFAAWTRSGASGPVIQARIRSAESGVWGSQDDVSRADAAVRGGPSLAVGAAGNAVAAWVLANGVVQAALYAGGWQPSVDLGSEADSPVDVALSPSGDAVAVWALRGDAAVVRAAFRPAGAAWTPAVEVTTTARPGWQPRVELDAAGNAHAVWVGASGPGSVSASTRSRASAAWSQPVVVSPPDRAAAAPQVAVDPAGNAVAAWTVDGVAGAAIRPAGGSWQPPVDLSRPNAVTGEVRLAMGRVGAALAVWPRFEPLPVRVEGSELVGAGPVVGDLAVPARAGTGVPVTMTVGAWPWAWPLSGEPAWSFGDGTSARGRSVRHAYVRPGRYTVVVTQADASGAASTATAAIVVAVQAVANARRPTIQGHPRVGATLNCNRGSWTGSPPIRYAYRWLRNARPVARATSGAYRVRRVDRGALIACRVLATNAAGSKSATSRPVRVSRR